MGANAKQMSLFEPAAPAAPAPADPEFVRRHLSYLLRLAQTSDRLPWSESRAASWEKLFGELVDALPDGEGERLFAAFQAELARLRAAP
jgi:hypothetical protein